MKRKSIYVFAAASALLLASCSGMDESQSATGTTDPTARLSFSVDVTGEDATRAGVDAFVDGNRFGVFVADKYANVAVTRSGGSSAVWNASENLYWPNGAASARFCAYYPYTDASAGANPRYDSTTKTIVFSAAADQSTSAAYTASDLLFWGREVEHPATGIVPVAFEHIMSRLQIGCTFESDFAADGAEISAISVAGLKTGMILDLASCLSRPDSDGGSSSYSTLASGGEADMIPLRTNATSFELLAVPQSAVVTIAVEVTCGGNKFHYTLDLNAAAYEYLPSSLYKVNLTISRDKIALGDFTIVDWQRHDPVTSDANVDFDIAHDPIWIHNAEQMGWVRDYIEQGHVLTGRTCILHDDIDMSSFDNWHMNVPFAGTFRGSYVVDADGRVVLDVSDMPIEIAAAAEGQTVIRRGFTNLTINAPSDTQRALFGVTQPTAVIKDLDLSGNVTVRGVGALLVAVNNGTISNVGIHDGSVSAPDGTSGGLVSVNQGTINNITSSNITINGGSNLGGIAAQSDNSATINNITVRGLTITASGSGVGGVVANGKLGGEVSVEGTVKGANNVGGLIASPNGAMTLEGASFKGTVEGAIGVGGLLATDNSQVVVLSQCSAEGTIRGTSQVGGAVGGIRAANSKLTSVHINNMTITGESEVGGVAGYARSGVIIDQAQVTSTRIEATSTDENYVGGCVGQSNAVISNFDAKSQIVVGHGTNVGGVCGLNNGTITSPSIGGSNSSVTGAGNTGGVVGNNAGALSIIQNYSLSNISVVGSGANTGGVAGSNNGTITAADISSLTGSISGATNVGGIAGINVNVVGDTAAVMSVSSEVSGNINVGGLVGQNTGTLVGAKFAGSTVRCKKTGITGADISDANNACTGGAVGINTGTMGTAISVENALVTGSGHYMGGLVGNNGGTIASCSISGTTVTSSGPSSRIGGVAGINSDNRTIGNVGISLVTVNCGMYSGGFVGENRGVLQDCTSDNSVTVNGGASSSVGGVVGVNVISNSGGSSPSATIGIVDNIKVNATVSSTGSNIGGLVGENCYMVRNCPNVTVDVTGGQSTGGAVGVNLYSANGEYHRGTVTNVTVAGTVRGGQNTGGYAGVNNYLLQNCTSGAINVACGTNSNIGGAAGSNTSTVSDMTLNLVTVNGGENTGGAVGHNSGTLLAITTTSGVVTGGQNTGGIAGMNSNDVLGCSAACSVTGGRYAGGIVGSNSDLIDGCKFAGSVSATANVGGGSSSNPALVASGGIVGTNSGAVLLCAVVGESSISARNTSSGGNNDGVAGGIVGYASFNNPSNQIRGCYCAAGSYSGDYKAGIIGSVGYTSNRYVSYSYYRSGQGASTVMYYIKYSWFAYNYQTVSNTINNCGTFNGPRNANLNNMTDNTTDSLYEFNGWDGDYNPHIEHK